MDISKFLEKNVLQSSCNNGQQLDETTCGSLCQHPSCWASQCRQEKGIPRVLPPLDVVYDSSEDELNLPTQSICNLFSNCDDSLSSCYPQSTGRQWRKNPCGNHSLNSRLGFKTSSKKKVKSSSKSSASWRKNQHMHMVEVQEVFDKEDLNLGWDETFVTKQYYVWVPNPNRQSQKIQRKLPAPVLMKDLTECMMPQEIKHFREGTTLVDEWPVLKKRQKHLRNRSPVLYKRIPHFSGLASVASNIDTEGINELLALPKETLMKVLERTKKSDFTTRGMLHSIVQDCARDDEQVQIALTARELFQHKHLKLLDSHGLKTQSIVSYRKPVFQLDDDGVIDRLSSVNTPVKEKDLNSGSASTNSFHLYKPPLPCIKGGQKMPINSFRVINQDWSKISSIALGLPELPRGIKTVKPFSYPRQNLDFSLGPVISPPSSSRSSLTGTYSDNGTTVKVHASSTLIGQAESDLPVGTEGAIHCVSPTLSTHVPIPPAGTPATFQSPVKSATVLPDYQDISRGTTYVTINWSQNAQPSLRDMQEDANFSTPLTLVQDSTLTNIRPDISSEELQTINETAREYQAGSVTSVPSDGHCQLLNKPQSCQIDLLMETEIQRSSGKGGSSKHKSSRSAESCPSPEQWPLISESSFDHILRSSASEPALSARSDRRRPVSRSKEDTGRISQRDFTKTVLDDKMTIESPAPPPPSPEPRESWDFRCRKDLRSRESLSMAPLFEVTEVEESPMVNGIPEENHKRQEQSRKIEVKIPVCDDKSDKGKEEENGQMVSQITVMHVVPKGGEKLRDSGKIQETFLNVDIPAEDISSVKAELGSLHQEDISSNETSNTLTLSEPSGSPRNAVILEGMSNQYSQRKTNKLTVICEGENVNAQDDHGPPSVGNAHSHGKEAHLPQTDFETGSPELQCDNSRFFSFQMSFIPPADDVGEVSTKSSTRMLREDGFLPLDETLQVDKEKQCPVQNENDRSGEILIMSVNKVLEVGDDLTKEDKRQHEEKEPGRFFFLGTQQEKNYDEIEKRSPTANHDQSRFPKETNDAEQNPGKTMLVPE